MMFLKVIYRYNKIDSEPPSFPLLDEEVDWPPPHFLKFIFISKKSTSVLNYLSFLIFKNRYKLNINHMEGF